MKEDKLVGHVERIGGKSEMHTSFWWGELGERDHCVEVGIDGKIILKMTFKYYGGGTGIQCIWSVAG